jgi:hypothetical protein
VVVLGGGGFFGGIAVALLRDRGVVPLTPSRGEADADDVEALRRYLRRGDVVLDAAGPFQSRTLALLDAAIDTGADVVDLSDSLDYAERVLLMGERVGAAGTRVLNGCSSVSAVTAAAVETSGIADRVAVSVCLAPASAETATRGTAASLLASLGAPVRRLRNGRLETARGWSEHRDFHALGLGRALGRRRDGVRGHLTESGDAVTLPLAWPGLRDVDFWVDANAPAVNALLGVLARLPGGGRRLQPVAPAGVWAARRLGSRQGGLVIEVRGRDGEVRYCSLTSGARSYLVAVLPAVLAVEAILAGRVPLGLVPANRQVPARELFAAMRASGIVVTTA